MGRRVLQQASPPPEETNYLKEAARVGLPMAGGALGAIAAAPAALAAGPMAPAVEVAGGALGAGMGRKLYEAAYPEEAQGVGETVKGLVEDVALSGGMMGLGAGAAKGFRRFWPDDAIKAAEKLKSRPPETAGAESAAGKMGERLTKAEVDELGGRKLQQTADVTEAGERARRYREQRIVGKTEARAGEVLGKSEPPSETANTVGSRLTELADEKELAAFGPREAAEEATKKLNARVDAYVASERDRMFTEVYEPLRAKAKPLAAWNDKLSEVEKDISDMFKGDRRRDAMAKKADLEGALEAIQDVRQNFNTPEGARAAFENIRALRSQLDAAGPGGDLIAKVRSKLADALEAGSSGGSIRSADKQFEQFKEWEKAIGANKDVPEEKLYSLLRSTDKYSAFAKADPEAAKAVSARYVQDMTAKAATVDQFNKSMAALPESVRQTLDPKLLAEAQETVVLRQLAKKYGDEMNVGKLLRNPTHYEALKKYAPETVERVKTEYLRDGIKSVIDSKKGGAELRKQWDEVLGADKLPDAAKADIKKMPQVQELNDMVDLLALVRAVPHTSPYSGGVGTAPKGKEALLDRIADHTYRIFTSERAQKNLPAQTIFELSEIIGRSKASDAKKVTAYRALRAMASGGAAVYNTPSEAE